MKFSSVLPLAITGITAVLSADSPANQLEHLAESALKSQTDQLTAASEHHKRALPSVFENLGIGSNQIQTPLNKSQRRARQARRQLDQVKDQQLPVNFADITQGFTKLSSSAFGYKGDTPNKRQLGLLGVTDNSIPVANEVIHDNDVGLSLTGDIAQEVQQVRSSDFRRFVLYLELTIGVGQQARGKEKRQLVNIAGNSIPIANEVVHDNDLAGSLTGDIAQEVVQGQAPPSQPQAQASCTDAQAQAEGKPCAAQAQAEEEAKVAKSKEQVKEAQTQAEADAQAATDGVTGEEQDFFNQTGPVSRSKRQMLGDLVPRDAKQEEVNVFTEIPRLNCNFC